VPTVYSNKKNVESMESTDPRHLVYPVRSRDGGGVRSACKEAPTLVNRQHNIY
jgi:hypothetical protein